MKTKPFTIQMETKALEAFYDVAQVNHLKPQAYAVTALAKLSQLKPEFALDALAAIPKEYFKRGPGRPSATAHPAHRNPAETTGNDTLEHAVSVGPGHS